MCHALKKTVISKENSGVDITNGEKYIIVWRKLASGDIAGLFQDN